jgi:multidrug efflux pump subunit AcrA (membrane-fusion protein)
MRQKADMIDKVAVIGGATSGIGVDANGDPEYRRLGALRLKMLTRSLALAGVLCVTAACGGQSDGPQTVGPEVNVMALQPQRIMLITEVPGQTSAFLKAEVRPQVSGTLLRRQFEEGADVRSRRAFATRHC